MDIRESLGNLAARAKQGEWPTEGALKSQVLRLWKGAEFTPPAPLAEVDYFDRARERGDVIVTTEQAHPPEMGDVFERKEPEPALEQAVREGLKELEEGKAVVFPDADAMLRDLKGECGEKRRHHIYSRRGEACPQCGYTKPQEAA